MADVELATFDRSDTDRLAVSFREYEGHHFIDLRLQYKNQDGAWLPSKKGITVKMRELHGVADALVKACELATKVRK